MSTILVVDDEYDMTSTLRAILEGEGYKVETCGNGKEALACIERSQPDLVLMDMMMPILGGKEAIRQLRGLPGKDQLPVILMSAAPPDNGNDGPWQAFLHKPFSLNELLTTVHQLIGKPSA